MLALRIRFTNHICGFLVWPEPNKTIVTKVIVRFRHDRGRIRGARQSSVTRSLFTIIYVRGD
jgi:hypothetical protein